MAKRVKKQGYVGFNKLEGQLGQRSGVSNPGALAAYIGRKKYGKKNFQSHAAQGKTMRGAKRGG